MMQNSCAADSNQKKFSTRRFDQADDSVMSAECFVSRLLPAALDRYLAAVPAMSRSDRSIAAGS
jgi:hypothetical protein